MGRWFTGYRAALAVMLLLGVFATELVLSVRHQSLSWDEGDHLFAGYMSITHAEFGLNPEHPPLVKALAALPLLSMHLTVPPSKHLPFFKDEAYFDGRDLIFGNGGMAGADRIVFRARMAAATLSILLGLLVFLAAREMFGVSSGLFALALIVFEPNMIAHGAYVTTDMGVSCFLFAAAYAFYRYVKQPTPARLLLLGLATGLALASKHSAVLLLPMGIALVVAETLWQTRAPNPPKAIAKVAVQLTGAFLAASAIALIVLWSFYAFRFSAHPGGVGMTPPLADYMQGLHGFEPRVYLALARWHLLPESYLYGLADVRLVSDTFPSYIFGDIYAHGVWFYFPAAFLIKSTIGFMALLLVAAFAMATRRFRYSREFAFFAIPPAIYFIAAMGTGLNIGARHILPMYAFLAVLIAGAVAALARRGRRWAYAAAALLALHAVSSARACPIYLAYSNELWGGPANTYKQLTDSNTDWGQQLHSVQQYLDRRGVKDCWFAYFVEPEIHFSAYGIPCKPLPTQDTVWTHDLVDAPERIAGTVLISAGTLTGYEMGSRVLNPYRAFTSLQPTAVIDHGVFVFDGIFDMRPAAALGHATRASELLAAHQPEAALPEARQAVLIDPTSFQSQMILGDTLMDLHRAPEAQPAYAQAVALAHTMEPSAAAQWLPKIAKSMSAGHQP